MEQEAGASGADQPATKADVRILKADIRLLAAEIRNVRTWAEGKFEALGQEVRALIADARREDGERLLRYFVGFFLAQVTAVYAIQRLV